MNFEHKSVLLNECIEHLNIKPNGVYIDGTMGGAGHSLEILKRLSSSGKLICIDQDKNAIEVGKKRLESFSNVDFIHDNFSNIKNIAFDLNLTENSIDGVLLDLGVSSHQLDTDYRGFSYMKDSKLDMRMDTRKSLSAYEVVNTYSKDKLFTIIKDFGEEKWAKRIAEFIVNERKNLPIETTFELVSVIKKAVPKSARENTGHPAKRTFQAIRIEVNQELDILKESVINFCNILKKGGRFAVITFHSLEDRLVKKAFKELENPCTCPRDFPICVCGKVSIVKSVIKKPIIPSEGEIEENRRSRSAKLRVIEKI